MSKYRSDTIVRLNFKPHLPSHRKVLDYLNAAAPPEVLANRKSLRQYQGEYVMSLLSEMVSGAATHIPYSPSPVPIADTKQSEPQTRDVKTHTRDKKTESAPADTVLTSSSADDEDDELNPASLFGDVFLTGDSNG